MEKERLWILSNSNYWIKKTCLSFRMQVRYKLRSLTFAFSRHSSFHTAHFSVGVVFSIITSEQSILSSVDVYDCYILSILGYVMPNNQPFYMKNGFHTTWLFPSAIWTFQLFFFFFFFLHQFWLHGPHTHFCDSFSLLSSALFPPYLSNMVVSLVKTP